MRKSGQDRKAEILQAALDVAFENGPDRLTTGMIADRLGLTQPAIYKHFKNKDDIWQGVADKLCTLIAANIADTKGALLAPEARIRQLVLGHLRLVQDHPALPEIMVMRDLSEAQRGSLSQIRASMAVFREALVETFRETLSGDQFRSDISAEDGATLIFGIIQGLVLRLLLSRDPAILLRDGERLLELQLSLLAEYGDNT